MNNLNALNIYQINIYQILLFMHKVKDYTNVFKNSFTETKNKYSTKASKNNFLQSLFPTEVHTCGLFILLYLYFCLYVYIFIFIYYGIVEFCYLIK